MKKLYRVNIFFLFLVCSLSSQVSKGYASDRDSLPVITTSRTHEISKGYIFISNIVFNPNIPNLPYLLILDNYGKTIFYKKMAAQCFDFKYQQNLFTYFMQGKYYAMNLNFNVVDSFFCQGGYTTDEHELQLLPNGHALMMSYDSMGVDMSKLVEGGDTNAAVFGLVLQEVDRHQNVVFQWRSWDHFEITDATHENLLAHVIDYVHGNSIELDHDGNIIISCRHMDEVTKINRQTGEIVWRLGGKNNQFTFTNDAMMFSHQHSARRLLNGNLLIFDNGNFHTPRFSRAIEYKLDEVHMTATKVWEYRNSPEQYGFAMGSVQRLANGNTLIGWGATNPTVTEVRPNGIKAFELSLPAGVFSYRAFRFMWDGAPSDAPAFSSLSQNYPNPFNSMTRIRYQIKDNSNVVVKIYDVLGREISTLVNEFKEAGIYYLDFDSSNLSSGVYFYKLDSDKYIESKRMVIIK
jgi:arylsulfotransferase ASST/type IX secretion system substrate protein